MLVCRGMMQGPHLSSQSAAAGEATRRRPRSRRYHFSARLLEHRPWPGLLPRVLQTAVSRRVPQSVILYGGRSPPYGRTALISELLDSSEHCTVASILPGPASVPPKRRNPRVCAVHGYGRCRALSRRIARIQGSHKSVVSCVNDVVADIGVVTIEVTGVTRDGQRDSDGVGRDVELAPAQQPALVADELCGGVLARIHLSRRGQGMVVHLVTPRSQAS